MPERVTFSTDDGVKLVGDWVPAPTMVGAALLLHMMPETRGSWAAFQRVLAKHNLGSLAIDLRGHGESTQMEDGDTIAYQEFQDTDHQSSATDVDAAIAWIRGRGFELDRIAVVGASIGANLAVQLLAEEPRVPCAVLLSPGENYRGLFAIEDARNAHPEQAIFLVASEEDAESFTASKTLYDVAAVDRKTFVPYQHAGHGTRIFKVDPALMEKIANWIVETLKSVS